MCKIISLFVFFFLGGTLLSAQDFESFKRKSQQAFQSYRQKTQEDFDAYRRKVNAEFAEFLRTPWEEKKGEDPVPEPRKEPDIPPVVFLDDDIEIPEDNLIDIEVVPIQIEDEPIPVAPIIYKPKPKEETFSFVFYGTTGAVRLNPENKAHLKSSSEGDVADFWEALSGEAFDNVLADCQKIRQDRDLGDWAYFKMTEKLAETLYDTKNERRVFHGWLLAQTGFGVKLGRATDALHLLVWCSSLIFHKPYWDIKGAKYYLMDDEGITSLQMVDYSFPNCSPLRITMQATNLFDEKSAILRTLCSQGYPDLTVDVSCDKNTIDYLYDVPVSGIDGTNITDYALYVKQPLSENARKPLYSSLSGSIAGKSEGEAANILLNFVQTAFEYGYDDEIWGTERPFFPEETLYYPYSDCEDRAILFSRLVCDLLGLDVALVLYPGHLATAVCFSQTIPGDYIVVNGRRFLICDPTYINAPIGLTMPGMENSTARVFLL